MIRFSSLLGAITLLFPFAGVSLAQIPISLASSNGNASTQTAAYGITPSAGTQQFLLTTINPAASLPSDGSLGTTPADTNVTAFNSYFGLPAGTLAARGIQDGSGYLTQQVTLTVGSLVRFDAIFLTNEDNAVAFNNDLAFFTVNGALVNPTLFTAGRLTNTELNAGSPSPNFNFQSQGGQTGGYYTFQFQVMATGNYTFGFGVSGVTTNTVYSGLLIDNITYSPIGTIPEPRTNALLVLGAGLGGLLFLRRRFRRA